MADHDRPHGWRDRPLSQVLLRITLLLALSLGTVAALIQVWIDLRQEKHAVEITAEEFLTSVAPSAASAAYNFYDPAAEQVVEGLFTQRAITSVTIVNDGAVMITRTRQVDPTLPAIGSFTETDEVVLEQPLYAPPETGRPDVIGSISATVDRSVVPPAIVNRMFAYFLLATLKNFILGVLLIAVVYGALTRHIVNLAEAAGRWVPSAGRISIPRPPTFLLGTELELLGCRIEQLAASATGVIEEIEESRRAAVQSNSELSQKSETLSQAVLVRTAELRDANEKLKELAERDALTGLYNRGSFDEHAADACEQAAAAGHNLAILLIDVDHFKSYNDYYGHQAGDACLVRVASLLAEIAEEAGVLVARYGGEEFVMLMSGDSARGFAACARRIHDAVAREDIAHHRSTTGNRLTISIGAVLSGADSTTGEAGTLDRLIAAADDALYEAKRNGRNRTEVSTSEIQSRAQAQRQASRTLLLAVEERRFEPFFQPQYDARDGRLVGAEALVRWRQEDGRIASPDAFMAAATENGVVQLIDHVVLEKAIDFLQLAASQGATLPRLSFNAPREGIREERYVDEVVKLAARTETRIAIELLETAVFDAPDDHLLWQLDRLREAGVEIEIDDFGTGHTSILSLMTLGPQRLKIAKELVIPMASDPAQEQIIRSVVEIGRSLEVEVLAEGVETEAVSRRLIEMNCPMQQGFVFSRPLDAAALLEMLGGAQEGGAVRKSG